MVITYNNKYMYGSVACTRSFRMMCGHENFIERKIYKFRYHVIKRLTYEQGWTTQRNYNGGPIFETKIEPGPDKKNGFLSYYGKQIN